MSIINFLAIYEWFFKSFQVDADTKLIKKLEEEGYKYAMLVKRDWIYAVFLSWWRIPTILFIASLNMYLLYANLGAGWVTWVAMIALGYNVISWIYTSVSYIFTYKEIYEGGFKIKDVYTLKKQLEESDMAYQKFFNQTNFNLMFFFFFSLFLVFHIVTNFGNLESTGYAILDIILYVVQMVIYVNFLRKMTDLEMDFNVVFPGKIYFFNQSGLVGTGMNMEAHKIKTISYKYPSLIASFFKYGNILILTEGDQATQAGEMAMNYIHDPANAMIEMDKLLKNQIENIKRKDNVYLKEVMHALELETEGVDLNNLAEEERALIRTYCKEQDAMIKQDYEEGSEEEKAEILELYKIISNTSK